VEHAGVWGYIPLDHCSQNASLSSTWGTQRKEGFNHCEAFSEKYCKSLCAHEREREREEEEKVGELVSFFFLPFRYTTVIILTAVTLVIGES